MERGSAVFESVQGKKTREKKQNSRETTEHESEPPLVEVLWTERALEPQRERGEERERKRGERGGMEEGGTHHGSSFLRPQRLGWRP